MPTHRVTAYQVHRHSLVSVCETSAALRIIITPTTLEYFEKPTACLDEEETPAARFADAQSPFNADRERGGASCCAF
jgi:hypothetical protein